MKAQSPISHDSIMKQVDRLVYNIDSDSTLDLKVIPDSLLGSVFQTPFNKSLFGLDQIVAYQRNGSILKIRYFDITFYFAANQLILAHIPCSKRTENWSQCTGIVATDTYFYYNPKTYEFYKSVKVNQSKYQKGCNCERNFDTNPLFANNLLRQVKMQ